MGLDVSGYSTDKIYESDYYGLHSIRVLGLFAIGLDKQITDDDIREAAKYLNKFVHTERTEYQLKSYIIRQWMYGNTWYDYDVNHPKAKPPRKIDYKEMKALCRFCDCEGMYIKDRYLVDVDYSKSYLLGNSNRLLEGLEIIKTFLAKTTYQIHEYDRKNFFEFYDLVEDEVNNGRGIIIFH